MKIKYSKKKPIIRYNRSLPLYYRSVSSLSKQYTTLYLPMFFSVDDKNMIITPLNSYGAKIGSDNKANLNGYLIIYDYQIGTDHYYEWLQNILDQYESRGFSIGY